ncbi:hypothetical protein SEA_SULLEY_83 [Mycobacterium phage Sulley]|uniref:Uncharacterized protein n=1 Tax=Mycobacterium phage Sulley TaxID=2041550 RepID=A0A2D2W3S1_9CAUD|nr:hypothetical protein SEA_SULLEY_83 [Mycobacterium phage Sulley]
MLKDRNAHIAVSTDGRQVGKTTLLLDVALANARRGLVVDFWSWSVRESLCAFDLARSLVPPTDRGVTFSPVNGSMSVRYPRGGRVRFMDRMRGGWIGTGVADMEVVDDRDGQGGVTRREVKGAF